MGDTRLGLVVLGSIGVLALAAGFVVGRKTAPAVDPRQAQAPERTLVIETDETPQPMPPSVDLRPQMDQWNLWARRTGRPNSATAFAVAGALETALATHRKWGTSVSPEFLNWACNRLLPERPPCDGNNYPSLLRGFEQFGVCTEREMPYSPNLYPEYVPSELALKTAKETLALGLRIHWIKPLGEPPGLSAARLAEVHQVLARGCPVAIGSNTCCALVVGYTTDANAPGGGWLLTRDFDAAPVHWEFARTRVNDAFWVEPPEPPSGR